MDWLSDDLILEEFNCFKNYITDDCKICWRSFAYKQPFSILNNLDYEVSEENSQNIMIK